MNPRTPERPAKVVQRPSTPKLCTNEYLRLLLKQNTLKSKQANGLSSTPERVPIAHHVLSPGKRKEIDNAIIIGDDVESIRAPVQLDNGQALSTGTAREDNQAENLWIHCNFCFEPYMRKRRPAYLLSCQHILCHDCLSEMVPPPSTMQNRCSDCYKCKMCEKIVRKCQIGNDMPDHLKKLFNPAPWNDHTSLIRIVDFQKYHRQNLELAEQKMLLKLRKENSKRAENKMTAKRLKEKRRNLKIEFVKLSNTIRQITLTHELEKAKRENDGINMSDFTHPASSTGGSTSDAQRCLGFVQARNPTNQPEIVPFSTINNESCNFNL